MLTHDFDKTNTESIKKQAEKVLHKSLAQVLDPAQIDEIKKTIDINRKGHLGDVVERYIFNKKQDNAAAPDFPEAKIELKTTPLKETRKGISAKERLVLGMINYFGIDKETWETSAFLKKNANLLILFYLYRKSDTILDYRFTLLKLLHLLSDLPPADIYQIQKDWETIADKVKAGKAHELSEGDTFYLGACTKGATAKTSMKDQPHSPIKAKGRAFSLKQTYLNYIISADRTRMAMECSTILPGALHVGIGDTVRARLDRYIGKTTGEIEKATNAYLAPDAKSYCADLARAMLGAKKKKIAEFEKADIKMKIVRLKPSGTPKESMSFPAIDYMEIVKEDWEDSTFREMLANRKYLFIIYRYDKAGTLRFEKYLLWNIPEDDLEAHVRKVWEKTKSQIIAGHADDLPKIKEDTVCHVRPHGRNKKDVAMTPYGIPVTKKCFWLNASYIAEQIKTAKN